MNLSEYCSQHRTRAKGLETGTVVKRGNKWVGLYHAYVTADGWKKRVGRRKLLGLCADMSKTDAKKALGEFLRTLDQKPAPTEPATFGRLAETYFMLRKANWSEAWERTLRSLFDHAVLPTLAERPLAEITAEELKLFVDALPRRQWRSRPKRNGEVEIHQGISASYAKKIITHVRAAFDLAVEKDLVRKNPAASKTIRLTIPHKATKPDKRILPPRDLLGLLGELSARDRLIVWICMLGGPRPNEIFALHVAQVGVDRLYIEGALDHKRRLKDTKTEKPREVLLPPMVRADLEEWIRSHRLRTDDLLFSTRRGTPLVRQNVLDRGIRKAAERAQIRTLDVDFQMMRRSFATVLMVLGGDIKSVQGQLGHARPDMTLTEYAQSTDVHLAAQLARAERILRGEEAWPTEAYATLTAKQTAREAVQ